MLLFILFTLTPPCVSSPFSLSFSHFDILFLAVSFLSYPDISSPLFLSPVMSLLSSLLSYVSFSLPSYLISSLLLFSFNCSSRLFVFLRLLTFCHLFISFPLLSCITHYHSLLPPHLSSVTWPHSRMLAQLPLATACCVDNSSNGVRASVCGRGYEAARCLEQKTTDSELMRVDRREAKHCGHSSIFREWWVDDGQEERGV